VGGGLFLVLKGQLLSPSLFEGTFVEGPVLWALSQHSNAFSCSTIGAIASVASVIIVSQFTKAPEDAHLKKVFGT
jgi:hypothetical protein